MCSWAAWPRRASVSASRTFASAFSTSSSSFLTRWRRTSMFFWEVRAPSRRACSCATRSRAASRRASDCARSSCGIVAVGGRHDPLVRQRADALPVVFRAAHLALHFGDRGLGFVERRLCLGQLVPDLLGLYLEGRSFLCQGALARGELRLRAGDLVLRPLAVELELFAGRLQLEGDHVDARLRLVEVQLVIRAVELQQHVVFLHHAAFVNVQRAAPCPRLWAPPTPSIP